MLPERPEQELLHYDDSVPILRLPRRGKVDDDLGPDTAGEIELQTYRQQQGLNTEPERVDLSVPEDARHPVTCPACSSAYVAKEARCMCCMAIGVSDTTLQI